MKSKIFKTSIILMLIVTMTMANLIFVGKTLITYAVDDVSTNVKNIEFGVYFKNRSGQMVTQLTPEGNQTEVSLFLQVGVKQDGYFNGQIELGKANFKIKENASTTSEYINRIEGNTIYLNQINAGSPVEIEVKVELLREEVFDLALLSMESEVSLKGIYKNSSERDVTVDTLKKVELSYPKVSGNKEDISSEMEVITNKEMMLHGEKRKVVQVALQLGLVNHSYPIKSIALENVAPKASDSSAVEGSAMVHLNTTTHWESHTNFNQGESTIAIEMTNAAKEGTILWKKQGNEEIILTYIAKAGATIESQEIGVTGKIVLYDGQEIAIEAKTTLEAEKELNGTITTRVTNPESEFYKGKLYQGINRGFSTNTTVDVNLANAHEYLEIKENHIFEQANKEIENGITANVTYQNTIFNKEEWFKVLGEKGEITVFNQKGEVITTIRQDSETNEQGNIVISYGEGQEGIVLRTTTPVNTGKLHVTHEKVFKDNRNLDLKAFPYFSTIAYVTNDLVTERTIDAKNRNVAETELKEPKTEAKLEVSKDSLSTVMKNNVEMKVILKSNNEAYELYKNPVITVALPEDVETIELTKVEMLYEEELKIKEYRVESKTIVIVLEGEQTNYTEEAVEGASIIIDANVTLNKRAATKDAEIRMVYTNEKGSHEENVITSPMKVAAPTEMTAIYHIDELGIATMGQEETTSVKLPILTEAKRMESYIEIINNKAVAIHDVTVLGVFPTNSQENTIGATILESLKLQGTENAKIYYTENEKASSDLGSAENGWSEDIIDFSKVKKYLISIEKMDSQSSVIATYPVQIPEGLEYNQSAKQGYEITYTDSETNTQNQIKSTVIEMTTGIGPRMEINLTGKVGTEQLNNNAKVKAGEVIRYAIEVSNTGTEEMKNTKIIAPIPEGTTYVEAKPNYEYTGKSYYQEVEKERYEETIETIKPGEKIVKQYEVRVNQNLTTGKEMKNMAEVTCGEMVKKTNQLQYISEAGDLRASVKRITDRTSDLYAGGVVQYFAMIENTSREVKENVTVQTNLPEGLTVEALSLITGLEDKEITEEDLPLSTDVEMNREEREVTEEELTQGVTQEDSLKTEQITYAKTISIGTLQPGETKVLSYNMMINQNTQVNSIPFSVVAKQGNNSYRSNEWEDTVNRFDITLSMTCNVTGRYIKTGDLLEYTIVVRNNSNAATNGFTLIDAIPEALTITKMTKDGEEIELPTGNEIEIVSEIEALSESTIKIEAQVEYDETREEPETISNKAEAKIFGETIVTSSEYTHIIEVGNTSDEGETGDNNQPDNNGTNNDVPDNNTATGNKMISGIAWYDENSNGKKDANEPLLQGVTVKLLNVETNQLLKTESGEVLQATTDEKGIYVLSHVGNGKYVAIFEYDEAQYALTKYQVEGVSQDSNSDVMMNELLVEENRKLVASTDIMEIQNDNISDINIGLIKLQDFHMKLDKYIGKIIIQNAEGTTVKEYTDATMAKLELDGKKINGTTAIIEYQIKVSNVGEVPGYVKKIADYVPTELTFNSELNKDWYQAGNTLYTTSLANTKMAAGESKVVTLTLTKALTENNIGRMNNTAEIVESYNELGLADSSSTPGNKAQGEDDMGMADAIISVKTGGAILYSSIIAMVILVLGVTVIYLQNRKMKKIQNTRKLDKIS